MLNAFDLEDFDILPHKPVKELKEGDLFHWTRDNFEMLGPSTMNGFMAARELSRHHHCFFREEELVLPLKKKD